MKDCHGNLVRNLPGYFRSLRSCDCGGGASTGASGGEGLQQGTQWPGVEGRARGQRPLPRVRRPDQVPKWKGGLLPWNAPSLIGSWLWSSCCVSAGTLAVWRCCFLRGTPALVQCHAAHPPSMLLKHPHSSQQLAANRAALVAGATTPGSLPTAQCLIPATAGGP